MSIYEKWSQGTENRDAETMVAFLHDDFTFIRHQTGSTMNKHEMSNMLRSFMGNDSVVVQSQKCLYENDEVMVEHSVMSFGDGSTESVLSFMRLKDGLIIETQTGATPIKK